MKRWFIWLLFAGVLLAGCGNTSEETQTEVGEKALEKVNFVLDWTPNTNHTGIYVAAAEGFFAEEGLEVEIMMPGETGADQLIASGKAEFGISVQEAITQARVQDVPIVSIAAIIQHNTSGFASPVSKNITSPKDFEGHTYGGFGAPVEQSVIDSLMKKDQADINNVAILNIGDTDFFTAVKRDVDFSWIYYGWTGVEAELRGEDLNMVYLTDYSEKLDYYTPVIATNENMINQNADVVQAFVNAVSKGYKFAIEHPEEAADILLAAAPDLDEELVKASQNWLSKRYQDDADQWGEQALSVWENYADWMLEYDLLEKPLNAEEAFTNQFIQKVREN